MSPDPIGASGAGHDLSSAAPVAGGPLPVGHAFATMSLTREHVKAGSALFFAFVIEAWEMLIVSYVSSSIRADFHIGAAAVGLLLSSMYFGMIPGALLWGAVTDRIGRKMTCIWSLAGYGFCCAASALAPNYWSFCAARFCSGFALAGILVAVFVYFEELLPVRHRGRATVFLAGGWPIGTLIAVGVTAGVVNTLGWRAVILISALSGLWALLIWRWVPESPYWLVTKGRQAEARAAIERLSRGQVDTTRELYVPVGPRSSARALFQGRATKITLLQVVVNFALSWGYWGLQTWLPNLLADRGLSLPASYLFITVSALSMIPGYLSAAWLTARYGRRRIYLSYVFLGTAGGLLFAFAPSMAFLYAGNVMMSIFAQGSWGVWDTWMAEVYETHNRGRGYSLGIAAQRVANAIAPGVIGLFVSYAFGFTSTVAFIEAFFVVALVLALPLPETEGEELT
ncbi:MFS transporter [Streptomyces sp. TS71-3]|uniref:MFS transporter n=1 Tax=Streptomyces sp. TS71-3 TaxID=2733862 RepID=UPI001B0B082C|nr:MFS transporter [Streptomyces sp. TS71-3]GHJ42097.1 MFS transporter [Streptomyces sp. TS71-3]